MLPYSLTSYRKILRTALARGYRFTSFGAPVSDRKLLLYLRHDLDYSLALAVELAKVNASLGVRGTFFVLFRSEIYNPLSPSSLEKIKQLVALRQSVGMHVHASADWGFGAPLEEGIAADFALFKKAIPEAVPVCSWHNPTEGLLDQFRPRTRIGGLVNTYASSFTQKTTYLADSNRRHSVETFLDALNPKMHPRLQFLFHPLYWTRPGKRLEDVFAQTWETVIAEREAGFMQNVNYLMWFPKGASKRFLTKVSGSWRAALPKGARTPKAGR